MISKGLGRLFLALAVMPQVSDAQQSTRPVASPVNVLSNSGSKTKCFSHVHRCIIPVYVHSGTAGTCTAWVDPETIEVPKPTDVPRIKVIWVLKQGDKGTKIDQFVFDKNAGISRNDNEPADQFNADGYDGTDSSENPNPDDDPATKSRRFRWASKNPSVGMAVKYTPNVYRTTGSAAHPVVTRCDANDPTIAND